MKHAELQVLLENVGPSNQYEALVSVDSSDLRTRHGKDRDAYFEEKSKLIQLLADRIRKALASDGTVDVFEDVGQIVVSANAERWLLVLKVLERLESKRQVKTQIFPNDKIPLIH